MTTRLQYPDREYRPWTSSREIVDIGVAIALLTVSTASFLISLPFGLLVISVLTVIYTVSAPAKIPGMLLVIFLVQNMVIASFFPLFPPPDENEIFFTAVRGINFAIIMTSFGLFLVSVLLPSRSILPPLRPWLQFSMVLLAAIIFYFFLGIIRGNASDAIIYFRNTVIPVACFFITLVAASRYRLNLDRVVIGAGIFAIVFGYLELVFTFDFLSLFNGDDYIMANIEKEIKSGHWETIMKETGFVLRNLDDIKLTPLFNTTLFGDIFPKVFRLTGPNFHSISFAYMLSVASAWMLFQNRFLLLVFSFPLLVVIGSKGAMILILMAILVRTGMLYLKPGTILPIFFSATIVWLSLAVMVGMNKRDYHVIGLVSGLTEFIKKPAGQGLGIGGNLSSTTTYKLDWKKAQKEGRTQIPVESALGVILYQMGIAGLLLFIFLLALVKKCLALFYMTGNQGFMFCIVSVSTLIANATLQEEAFYSPLAMGFCLMLVAFVMGTYWRESDKNSMVTA